MTTPSALTRRRARAAALRDGGLSTRQIADRLGVSQPTVVRDLRAHYQAEGEAVLAALAGDKPKRPARPKLPSPYERHRFQEERWKRIERYGKYVSDAQASRRYKAVELRKKGLSLREIARAIGISPATVLRDLRRRQTPGRKG